jgi:nucleoside triphosphate diphosphatase
MNDPPIINSSEPAGAAAGRLLDRLVELMARLRGPEGCPWDRAQDYDSMQALLLEEAYEVIDAVNERDFDELQNELGDLLFQVVFYSRLAEEEGRFTLAGVTDRLYAKLVRRHAHVFGEVKALTAEEALKSWNAVKEQERQEKQEKPPGLGNAGGPGKAPEAGKSHAPGKPPSLLDGIAPTLPSTLEAHELGMRAAEAGFDWPRAGDVLDKVQEEVAELRRELEVAGNRLPSDTRSWSEADRSRLEDELGDLLFSISQLARHLGTDPESCLRRGNQKFRRRFQALERELGARGRKLAECDLAELEAVWNSVKSSENP